MKKFLFILLGVLMLSVFAACGNNEGNEEPKEAADSTEEATEEASEKTINDAMGEVTIPANPERIVAPYLEDSLVALGITPAAQWSIGESVLDYLQPSLKDVPKVGWDLPLEQVTSHNPDLIVFSSSSSIQNGLYEEYKKIAPTYVYEDEVSADWREQFTTMGEIVGKTEEAETALKEYDAKATEAKEKLNEAIGDESVAILWMMSKQFYVFEPKRHSGNVLYGDLGLKAPTFVESLPEVGATWDPITLEKMAELDADHIFLVNSDEAGVDELFESSIWKGLPAVQKDQVYRMKDSSNWTITGKIANEKTIDEVVGALVNE